MKERIMKGGKESKEEDKMMKKLDSLFIKWLEDRGDKVSHRMKEMSGTKTVNPRIRENNTWVEVARRKKRSRKSVGGGEASKLRSR